MRTAMPSYSLFEYERDLAGAELEALSGQRLTAADIAARLTFAASVEGLPTEQFRVEARHHALRGTRSTRQATRYLVHGLHEYKGKFNPQMARALINAVDPSATSLLDPFCGSGTTVVEGRRLGLNAAGIDQNPLARWMAEVKAQTLSYAGLTGIASRFETLVSSVCEAMKVAQDGAEAPTPPQVESRDDVYLRTWFPEPVLAALWAGLAIIEQGDEPLRDVARLCLSNIIRQVSWQLPEDLRVRRRPPDWCWPNVAEHFSVSADRGALALSELETMQGTALGEARILFGSSREPETVGRAFYPGRRLVVTSPPYATALPYIDTDRLSIVLLGLDSSGQLRNLEQSLTGSREWNAAEARAWARRRAANQDELPADLQELLSLIAQRNADTGAGFRRAAVPNLLYRYFAQMADTLSALRLHLTAGEAAVFVVGTNRTGAGNAQTLIDTPALLASVARTRGYSVERILPFQTWARYGMHSRNAVNSESAVILKAEA